jgi:hypothetical protein
MLLHDLLRRYQHSGQDPWRPDRSRWKTLPPAGAGQPEKLSVELDLARQEQGSIVVPENLNGKDQEFRDAFECAMRGKRGIIVNREPMPAGDA